MQLDCLRNCVHSEDVAMARINSWLKQRYRGPSVLQFSQALTKFLI